MNIQKVALTLILTSGWLAPAYSASDYGLPGEFMNFGSGARPQGMGRAFIGLADDIDALFWNPAGLASYRSSQVGFQYSPMPLGGSHQYLAYSQPMQTYGTLGLGILNLTSGDIPRIDANNIENGSYNHRGTGYFASYAYRFKGLFSVGTNLKMAEKITDGRSARGFGVDAGTLFYFKERARIGAALRNLVPPSYSYASEKETFPVIFRTGASANFFNKRLTTALDLDKTLGTPQGMKWHLGVEGSLVSSVFLRAGVDGTEYTAGLGVRFKNIQIDYAAGFGEIGLVNRTSMKVVFGGFEIDAKAHPKVFSPLGLKKVTTFKIDSGNRSRITNWILTIRNTNGDVVRSFNGYNNPPKKLEWDGKDAEGKLVPDGEYVYRMSITDTKNITELTPQRTVKIVSPTPFEIEAK